MEQVIEVALDVSMISIFSEPKQLFMKDFAFT